MKLVPGQKVRLEDVAAGDRISVDVDFGQPGLELVLFGLSGSKRIENDRYTVLKTNVQAPGRELVYVPGNLTGTFEIDLDALPSSISRLLLVAAHGTAAVTTFGPLVVTIGQAAFDVGAAVGDERAVMMVEIYRNGDEWRLSAIGQGYNAGLPRLIEQLGGQLGPDEGKAARHADPVPVAKPVQPPSAEASRNVRLAPSQEMSVQGLEGKIGNGPIILNLTWTSRDASMDLDLGCLYELVDGSKGIVQALGKSFGAFVRPPYISLDKDDRGGSSSRETIRINGEKLDDIRRIAVFALIYEGAVRWSETDAMVTISLPGRPDIEVAIREGNDRQRIFGLIVIDNDRGSLRVTNHMTNYPNQKDFADSIGLYLNWREGRKE